MNETIQNILGLILLAAVFLGTRYVVALLLKRGALKIIDELKARSARDAGSAVDLIWAKPNWLRFGLRDYRPKALKSLLEGGVVVRTEAGRYYLSESYWTRKEVSPV